MLDGTLTVDMNKNLRKARLILNGLINHLLYLLVHSSGFRTDDSILIFGALRSGSTWLSEIVSSLDGHLQIFEPLHPKYVSEARDALPKDRPPFVASDDEWVAGVQLFRKILSGKLVNSWVMSQTSSREVISAKRLVIKFVRGNMLLGWLSNNFTTRPPILVIRHPCAIISSQLKKEWSPGKKRLLSNRYLDSFPEIRSKCEQLNKPEELAALAWCLRYHAPLTQAKSDSYILVSYEKLVRDGESELGRLFQLLNLEFDKNAIKKLTSPSDTSTGSSQIMHGKDPLAGWRSHLSENQVSNIVAVVSLFNLDFYTSELEPDYVRLSEYGLSQNG